MVQTISIINHSASVNDAVLWRACQDVQAQVSGDFAPRWNTDGRLRWGGSGWPVTLKDAPGAGDPTGVAGYHGQDGGGQPYAVVYAQPPGGADVPWSATLSHEILEMLADPYGERAVLVDTSGARNGTAIQVIHVEVCDPVQTARYQRRGGHHSMLSDFVYPQWYDARASGPRDFRGVAPDALVPVMGGVYKRIDATSTRGWVVVSAFG